MTPGTVNMLLNLYRIFKSDQFTPSDFQNTMRSYSEIMSTTATSIVLVGKKLWSPIGFESQLPATPANMAYAL